VFVGFDNRKDFDDLLRMELKTAYISPVKVVTFFLLLPGPQSASGEVMKILAVPDLGQTLWSWMWNYGSFLEVVYTSTLAQAPTSLTLLYHLSPKQSAFCLPSPIPIHSTYCSQIKNSSLAQLK
jgi:hypothetical protein